MPQGARTLDQRTPGQSDPRLAGLLLTRVSLTLDRRRLALEDCARRDVREQRPTQQRVKQVLPTYYDGSTYYGATYYYGSTYYGCAYYGSTYYGSTCYGSTYYSNAY